LFNVNLQTLHFNSFSEDVNQSIPIVLPVTTDKKEKLFGCDEISLYYNSKPVAILRKSSFYPHRKEERVCRQFGTSHPNHPYIKVHVYILCIPIHINDYDLLVPHYLLDHL